MSTYRICSVLGGVYLGSGMMHDQVVNGTSEYDVSTTLLKLLSCMSYTCPILNIVQEISLLVQFRLSKYIVNGQL